MTHLATMGTFSCATMAIAGFKGNNIQINEEYKASKKPDDYLKAAGLTVANWRQSILLPPSQPLGKTHDLPLELLMEQIEACDLKDKFVIATLNHAQYLGDDQYWPKELTRWGFKLVDKTMNNWGSMCYVYIRNRSQHPIKKDEHITEV